MHSVARCKIHPNQMDKYDYLIKVSILKLIKKQTKQKNTMGTDYIDLGVVSTPSRLSPSAQLPVAVPGMFSKQPKYSYGNYTNLEY